MSRRAELPEDLPASPEHEMVLLGHLLYKPQGIGDVIDILEPRHFSLPEHVAIFNAMVGAANRGQEPDKNDLAVALSGDRAVEEAGAYSYLSQLLTNALTIIDPTHYARMIRDLADRRTLWEMATMAANRARLADEPAAARAQIEDLETQLAQLAMSEGQIEDTRPFRQVMQSTLKHVEAAWSGESVVQGVPTGFGPLDRRLRGLRTGEVYVLAARPGVGKSALAVNIALNVVRSGQHAAIFSMEMSADRLANRMLADVSGVAARQLDTGQMSSAEWAEVARAGVEMETLPLSICERPAASPSFIRSEAKRMARRTGPLALLVIDYLQLMQSSQWSRGKNRVTELSEITGEIKQISKELRVPILLLSQLSRGVEQRDDKRPQLSDLRDSGSIEQDADVVMFIYREEYYLSRSEPDPGTQKYDAWWHKLQASKSKAEIITAKFREGTAGRDMLGFDPARVRFYDPEQGADQWQADVRF